MQRRPAYPADTATGACFITGNYDPSEGIVDLDLYLDVLPAFGRLCVSPIAVRMMAQTLGLEIPEDNVLKANAKLRDENRELRTENTKLRLAFTHFVDAIGLDALEKVS